MVALLRTRPRTGAGVSRHAGNAAAAAAIANRISSRVDFGVRATTSSKFAGFLRSIISFEFDSTHFPSIKFRAMVEPLAAVAIYLSLSCAELALHVPPLPLIRSRVSTVGLRAVGTSLDGMKSQSRRSALIP